MDAGNELVALGGSFRVSELQQDVTVSNPANLLSKSV